MKKFLIILIFLSFLTIGGCAKLIDTPQTQNNQISTFSAQNKIIVVKLEGLVSLDWVDQLEKAFQKKDCLFVIAWTESPGGSVIETKLTAHKIRALKEKYKKDLIVYSERGLYSGAYWVVCEANAIIIAPSGETGSIGVFTVRIDETASDSIKGVKYILIRSGRYKTTGFSHTKISDEEKEVLQNQVNDLYYEFLQQIYDCRENQINQACQILIGYINDTTITYYLTTICDGRTYDAKNAFDLGFIDSIMYFDELIKEIYSKAPQGTIIETEDGEKIKDFYPEK